MVRAATAVLPQRKAYILLWASGRGVKKLSACTGSAELDDLTEKRAPLLEATVAEKVQSNAVGTPFKAA